MIVLGGCIPTQQYADDSSEMRKIITTVVMAGNPLVHLDNLPNGEAFGNASLASALTSTLWQDRLLGFNRQITLPNKVVWGATGNNTQYKGDLGRRVVRCRLETDRASPEERTDFKYSDLLKHVCVNRPKYVRASITLLAAYLQAGRPSVELPAAGSYTEWTELIRYALVWAGCPDPWLTNRSARSDLDTEISELTVLIDAWQELDPEGTGITTAQAKSRYATLPLDFSRTAELLSLLNCRDFDANAVGYALRKHKRRPLADGRRIVDATGHGKVKRWRITSITPTD